MFSCEFVSLKSPEALANFRSLFSRLFNKREYNILKLHEVGCPDVFIGFIEMSFFYHSEVYETVLGNPCLKMILLLLHDGIGGGGGDDGGPAEN